MIIDNRYYRIKSIFGYRLRALLETRACLKTPCIFKLVLGHSVCVRQVLCNICSKYCANKKWWDTWLTLLPSSLRVTSFSLCLSKRKLLEPIYLIRNPKTSKTISAAFQKILTSNSSSRDSLSFSCLHSSVA